MKLFYKILIVLICCISEASGQTVNCTPSVLPATGSRCQLEKNKGWHWDDSGFILPNYNARKSAAGIQFNIPGRIWYDRFGDSSVHFWDGLNEIKLWSERDGSLSGGGGGGSTSGANGDVQYDSSGYFGANNRFNWSGTRLNLNSGTLGVDALRIYGASTGNYLRVRVDTAVTTFGMVLGVGFGTLEFNGASVFNNNITMRGQKIFAGTPSTLIGFYGNIPIAQPTGNIKTALSDLGLIRSPTLALTDISDYVPPLLKLDTNNHGGAITFDYFNSHSGGGGTVTSIDVQYGLLGGTITTTGAIKVDSVNISTVGYRKKGDDSVAGLIQTYTNGYALNLAANTFSSDSFLTATKNRLYKVRDSLIGIGYLTAESDPIANAHTVTIGSSWGITGGGAAQSLSSDPSRTLKADSTVIATTGYRKKGDDSVAALALARQAQLNGTGFVKATGTTISYDNSTYLTAAVTSVQVVSNAAAYSVTPTSATTSTGIYSIIPTGTSGQFVKGDGTLGTSVSGTVTSVGLVGSSTMSVTGTASPITGAGTYTLTVPASSIGTVNLSATGTPSATTFLRGDNTWSVPAGGSGTVTSVGLVGSATLSVTGTASPITGTGTYSLSIPASVPLAGSPTTTTQSAGDNSTKIATTAYVDGGMVAYGVQTITATSYSVSCTPTTTVTATTSTVYFDVTAQAGALLFNAPTGTWAHHQHLMITVKDNGTARALTYNSIYRNGTTVTPPANTTISKELKLLYEFNANATKFDLLAYVEGY